jgi:hypothetical protein
MNEEISIPNGDLTEEQKIFVSNLSDEELNGVDQFILSIASYRWKKVAMLVATVMLDYPGAFDELPDVFYSLRIRKLVEDGKLELQGNLMYMRFSEVRLPNYE